MTYQSIRLAIQNALEKHKWAKLVEILGLFAVAIGLIKLTEPLAGDDLLAKQLIVWVVNMIILVLIWVVFGYEGKHGHILDFPLPKSVVVRS